MVNVFDNMITYEYTTEKFKCYTLLNLSLFSHSHLIQYFSSNNMYYYMIV